MIAGTISKITGPVVVAGGAGDNAAAACGVGVVTPGSAFVSIGTSGVLFVSNAAFSPKTIYEISYPRADVKTMEALFAEAFAGPV